MHVPENDPAWVRVPASTTGRRSVRVKNLDLPGKPEDVMFSLANPDPREFTFVTSFSIDDVGRLRGMMPGLLIKQISDNWEIYLNGSLVKREMYLDDDGNIRIHRNLRDVLVFLNPYLARNGENILAFRIVGDPREKDTGFYKSSPIIIGNYEDLLKSRSETMVLIVLAIYLLIGFFHMVLFLYRTSERYNLYFALFAIVLFVYQFFLTNSVNDLVFNTAISYRIEFCSLYCLFPLFLFFCDTLLFRRIRIFSYVYGGFCLLLVALSIPTPYLFTVDILRTWQMTAIIPLLYFILFQIGYSFKTTVAWYRATMKTGMSSALRHALTRTAPGNLLVGSLVLFGCATFDLIEAVYLSWGIWVAKWGFLFFVVSITMLLSNRFMTLYRKIDGLSHDLKEKSRDLVNAHVEIGMSHERYRLLVERTNDIVFTLDERLRLITANQTMCGLLGRSIEDLCGTTLLELLHQPEEMSMTLQFIQEKIDRFLLDRKPLNIKLDFKSPLGIEPIPMQVRLELIAIEGRYEIFGRGTDISEDILNQYLESERQRYSIGNLLMVADDLSHRITRNLHRVADKRDINMVRLAVREMIINAIEHGNLGITFDEKTREMMADNYLNYINDRQKDPSRTGRSIRVDYHLDRDTVIYTITDEGSGFDYRRFLNSEFEVNDEMLPHGRGIALAQNVFDEIRYNETGNSVVLVRKFERGN